MYALSILTLTGSYGPIHFSHRTGSPYYVILLAQAGNGLVLPLTLILLLMVANKTRIMGTHRNSRLTNVLGVIVVLVISWLALLQLKRFS